ncbi:MAG: hypothetical protein AAF934_11860 [Bacteroidota bacterium]
MEKILSFVSSPEHELAMKKAKALSTLHELPEEFELDELIKRLIFIDKVEKGLQQAKEGKTISHEQLKAEMKKW